MNYITDSVGAIAKILSIMIGEGFSTGTEDSLIRHPNLGTYYTP